MGRPPILSGHDCRFCGSAATSKAGRNRNGTQRYHCRSCRGFFIVERKRELSSKRYRKPVGELPSAGQLILRLIAISQRIGRTPTTGDIAEQSRLGRSYPLGHYYYVFGSYLNAVQKAGLPANYKREFNREHLIAELRDLHRKIGRPLFGRDVVAARKRGQVSPLPHFAKVFGSVPKAIAAAGAGEKAFSRDQLIAILRGLAARLDRPVLKRDVAELYRQGKSPCPRRFEREFGGWPNARRAAGITNVWLKHAESTKSWQRYTKGDMVEQLRSLGKKLGRRPQWRDANEACSNGEGASATTFCSMFGSFAEALRAAGFENVKPAHYTDREITESVREFTRRLGRMPTFHEFERASIAGECPSPGTIRRRLGRLRDLKPIFEAELRSET